MDHSPPSSDSKPSRRRFLAALGMAGLALGLGFRLVGYRRFARWQGEVLRSWEAEVVAAAAEVLLDDGGEGRVPAGPSATEIARNVDDYLVWLPAHLTREIHGLMLLLEHGTLLHLRARRFTRLSRAARSEHLHRLRYGGGGWRLIYSGIRDLCMIGCYQERSAWQAIGYHGPLVEPPADGPVGLYGWPRPPSRYDRLVAPEGDDPPRLTR